MFASQNSVSKLRFERQPTSSLLRISAGDGMRSFCGEPRSTRQQLRRRDEGLRLYDGPGPAVRSGVEVDPDVLIRPVDQEGDCRILDDVAKPGVYLLSIRIKLFRASSLEAASRQSSSHPPAGPGPRYFAEARTWRRSFLLQCQSAPDAPCLRSTRNGRRPRRENGPRSRVSALPSVYPVGSER